MSISDPSLQSPPTLADVISRLSRMDGLAPQRRKDLTTSLRRVAQFLGESPDAITADPASLRDRLALLSAAAVGVSQQRWRNIRSLAAAALDLAGARMVRRRIRGQDLPASWAELLGRIGNRYERARLSRLASYCSVSGIAPEQVDDAVIKAFGDALKTSLINRPKQVHRDACLAWNRSADKVPGWPATTLRVPDNSRTYALPITAYPASFKADLDAWMDHLAGKDLFSETGQRPASPTTLRSNRLLVLQFAAAVVLSGRNDAVRLTSLKDLIDLEVAKAGLSFLWERSGRKKTGHLHHYGQLLVKIAKHWVKVPTAQLMQIQALSKHIAPGHSGITPRNRVKLRQFNDETNIRRLLSLPQMTVRALPPTGLLSYGQAIQLQSALAIAILLAAPMRVKNLANLTLDRHLLQGQPGGARHLIVPADEVKNRVGLEFMLPTAVQGMLEVYLLRARPALLTGPSNYLFPTRRGGAKPEAQLSIQIKKAIARQAGLDLNAHGFRHLAAKLFLQHHPGEYETVRLLLGHKNLATTVRAYCDLEQGDALRRYDQLIDSYLRRRETDHAA